MDMKSSIQMIRGTLKENMIWDGKEKWQTTLIQMDLFHEEQRVLAVELFCIFDYQTFLDLEEKDVFGLTKESQGKNLMGEFDQTLPIKVVLFLRPEMVAGRFDQAKKDLDSETLDLIGELTGKGDSPFKDPIHYEYLKVYQEVPDRNFEGGFSNEKYLQPGTHFRKRSLR